MKKAIIILNLLLFLTPAASQAQEDFCQTHKVSEVALNDNLKIRSRCISRSEYETQKQVSARLRGKPFKAITDLDRVVKMLGRRLKVFDKKYEDTFWQEYEITFKDGTKKYIDNENVFVAYYPELETLLFDCNGGDRAINLNDSTSEGDLDPKYCVVSFDKRWRINGRSPDNIAYEDHEFYLEQWNDSTKRYEKAGDLLLLWGYDIEWIWVDNNKILYTYIRHTKTEEERYFYEMEIIEP